VYLTNTEPSLEKYEDHDQEVSNIGLLEFLLIYHHKLNISSLLVHYGILLSSPVNI
jgi:hypothetical protein